MESVKEDKTEVVKEVDLEDSSKHIYV